METIPEWRMEYNVTLRLMVYRENDSNVIHFTTGDDDTRVVGVWVRCPDCGLLCVCEPHLEIWNGAITEMMHQIRRNTSYTLLLTQTKHVNKVDNEK